MKTLPFDGSFISPNFDPMQETCWSADSDLEKSQSYFVSFFTGRTSLDYKAGKHFVRAVRSN